MKDAKPLLALTIVAVTAVVLAASGCVEDAGDIAEDISGIGEKEYIVTLIKGEKRQVAVDSEYALLLKKASAYSGEFDTKQGEIVVEIFSDFGNLSIGQRTLKTGGQEVRVERLTLELVSVDSKEEYAEVKISERIDIVGGAEKAGETAKKIAEAVAKSQS